MDSLLNQTYSWTRKWSKNRYGMFVIFFFLFLDSSVFPLPTTVIFITISLLQPARSYYNALLATFGMVSGALLGYTIGHYLWLQPDGSFTPFANYMFGHIPGFNVAEYQNTQALYLKWRYSILFFSIVLPIPYLFLSISAGSFDFNLFTFALSTFIFQGFRFVLLAWLIVRYGEGVKTIFHHNLKIITLITIILLLIILLTTRIGT